MAVNLSFIGGAGWQFFTDDGVPLSGGKIYTYVAGTTTPLATYTSRDGLTANANPIILDAAGRTPQQIWSTEGILYKYVVKDSDDVLIRTWDNIGGSVVASNLQSDLASTTNNALGDALIGFRQSNASGFLAGSVGSTLNNKLQEFVSIRDFGAVGDGVVDDTAAVQAALDSEQPLDWGGLTYRITGTVSRTYTNNVYWEGRTATILYDGAHVERAVRLLGGGIEYVVNDLTVDGGKLCNKCLEIDNNTDAYSSVTFNNVFVTRAKRLNTFNGGNGALIRGSFNNVVFNGGGARDCELPLGQGTPGSIGISGISVNFYSETRYCKRATFNGVYVEKIYSSDLTYTSDQDGVVYFSPTISGGSDGKIESDCLVTGNSRFVNCYGRAIKTQVRNTVVKNSHFERTEGFTSGVGNSEISPQSGSCVLDSCTFSYRNGQNPSAVISPSTITGWKAGASITNNEVYLETGAVLTYFVQTFPSGVSAPWSRMEVVGNKVLGSVEAFIEFLTNSNKSHLTVADNWVEEIAPSTNPNVLGERNLIYVRTSGNTPPEGNYAYINARSNVYVGSETVYLLRARVPGTSMDTELSAYDNFGFVNNWTGRAGDTVPNETQALAARLTGLEADRVKGYFGMQTKTLAAGVTETFPFRALNASLIILQVSGGTTQYAIFSASNTTTSISVGAGVALGTTTNPGTGNFNVWCSANGTLSVQNNTGTSRNVSIWIFAPN